MPDRLLESRSAAKLYQLPVVHIDHVGLHILVETVLAICAPDAGLSPARMKTLHGFEVLSVHIGFAEFQP